MVCHPCYWVLCHCFMGRLLALFKCSKSKFPFVDPLLVFASAKYTFFHGWQVFVGMGGTGFVCRSLLSFAGGRRKVFSYYCGIGALLGQLGLPLVVRCRIVLHDIDFLHGKEPKKLMGVKIIAWFGVLVLCVSGEVGRA